MISDPPLSPPLAPPGAGLPVPELVAARMIFAWHRFATTRVRAESEIATECDAVVFLVQNCDPEVGAKRVLIPRLRGMEDSSRHWSVFMTLEHLRIVNNAIAEIISLLAQGRSPARAASTAAVKPSADVDAGVIEPFVRSCAAITQAAGAVPNLHTSARYAHPWFGLLNAAGWHAMAGFHMRLHRRQIESILARMAPPAGSV
jgi:hypothetical protein